MRTGSHPIERGDGETEGKRTVEGRKGLGLDAAGEFPSFNIDPEAKNNETSELGVGRRQVWLVEPQQWIIQSKRGLWVRGGLGKCIAVEGLEASMES